MVVSLSNMGHILIVLMILQLVQNILPDCIVGETWYEKCRKCKCNINQKPKCEIHSCNSIAVCPTQMIWMTEEQRCYCDRPLQHSVCVDIEFQKEMRGHACVQDSFFYDTCTLCICQGGRTACVAYSNCFNPRGGICNEGESIIDNCFNCTCTHTRFLKCVLIEKCWSREIKPGKCPTKKNMFFDLGCVIGIDQECHFDYECPESKKCCQVTECSFRCLNAVTDE